MTLTPEAILNAQKTHLEALFGLTQKAFDGVEKLVELNVSASRAALSDAANHSQQLLSVKDAQQLLALQARQSIQAQQLQITQDRAAALEQARQVAVQERAREVRRRFMGDGTPYTPAAVNFYSE